MKGTALALTIISVVALCNDAGGIAILLWGMYGVYKIIVSNIEKEP